MEFQDIKKPEDLLDFMSSNITYGFVGKNGKIYTNPASDEWNDWYKECLVQTGDEVLDTKVGTCWDQVELERIWFEKNNFEFKTFFIWFEKYNGDDYPSHTFLIYKSNNKYYWFENSFGIYRGIHEFNGEIDAINEVIKNHLEYAKSIGVATDDDKNYIKHYEYSRLIRPLNVDEYINHVVHNKDIKKHF